MSRDWQAVLQAFIDCPCPLKVYFIWPATVKFWRFSALLKAAEALLAALDAAAALPPAPAANEAGVPGPAATAPFEPPAADPAAAAAASEPPAGDPAAIAAAAAPAAAAASQPPPGLTPQDVVHIERLDYTEDRVFTTSGPCLPPTTTWQPHPMVLKVRELCCQIV